MVKCVLFFCLSGKWFPGNTGLTENKAAVGFILYCPIVLEADGFK